MNLALLEMCATTPLHETKVGRHNSAIMSMDTYDKETIEMYANIIDIVQLQYIQFRGSSVCGFVVLSLV